MRGNIRAEQHAQELEQVRWDADGWVPIPESEAPQLRRYQCQKCNPDGNPIGR
jgi:hypothetical protein